jgi:CheY-like chemotaxis protein
MNLVINGAEAIGENATGRVEIRTSLRPINPRESADLFGPEHLTSRQYLQLEVSDTGVGMDETTKARIFDPFFTTKFTGRGLGLAAVQGIVKQHGGALRVYSTPGHGTTFMVLFPASVKSKVSSDLNQPTASVIPPGSSVLIVDDEEVVRNIARKVLSKAGMRVLVAENGQEGVDMFRAHQGVFSVVVLDLTMPVMGGEEAMVKMKEINPQVPIIISTGFDQREASQRFGQFQPASFLQKPYTNDRLVQTVSALFASKSD